MQSCFWRVGLDSGVTAPGVRRLLQARKTRPATPSRRVVRPGGPGHPRAAPGVLHRSTHAPVRPIGVIARRRRVPRRPSFPGMTENIETVIVGAGQAGLATAYHLTRLGRE